MHDLEIEHDLKVKAHVMNFLVNASPPKPLDVATSNCICIGHIMYMVLGNILCDLDLRSRSNTLFSCKCIS